MSRAGAQASNRSFVAFHLVRAYPRTLLLLLLAACAPPRAAAPSAAHAATLLPDVRVAPGRPPVVLVARDGDPAAAVAVAITTAGIGWGDRPDGDDPDAATALAGIVEARLRARNLDPVVWPSHGGLRASILATTETDASRIGESLRDVLGAPINDGDLAIARRKLQALASRPLRDRALGRWARCVGQPFAAPERAGRDYADLDLARLERWRAAANGLGRVAVAVTGPAATADAVATSILQGPAWKAGAPLAMRTAPMEPSVDVFETAAEPGRIGPGSAVVHATLDVGTSSAAVTTAEALGDPRGPLAARLSELDLPFRLREVTGAAHVGGGCVGVVLEAIPSSPMAATTDLATHVADAVALVHLEANVHLTEIGAARDGRVLSRRAGDARESAERAAWWALADHGRAGAAALMSSGGSIALAVPARRGVSTKEPASVEPTREALASAIARARAAWEKPVVDARSRVESGQGEAWVLVASPCGTDGEGEADSGLTAIFAAASAEVSRATSDVRIEPWVVADGVGLLVHGPPLAGETPAAHARRLADVAARSFAAEPITNAAIVHARADLLRRDARNDGGALSVLATALAPLHPSSVVAWGASEPLARSSDAAVLLRAQALRAGPIRVAVLANGDATQAEAAVRAADRWVPRRAGDARTCRPAAAAAPPRPGTYAAPLRPGAMPEAYLAFPFAPGDEAGRVSALVLAAALDGDGALLDRALGGTAALAREASARVIGWPRAPALVVRIVAPQASLDAAVMQARALLDRVHKGGLAPAELERATAGRARGVLTAALDPRARVVATWRSEPADGAPRAHVTTEDVRAFAARSLGEEAMVVVAARPARVTPP